MSGTCESKPCALGVARVASASARGPWVETARAATLRLSDGTSLIDMASGGFGYGARAVVDAVAVQVRRNPLATRHFLSAPLALLSERLTAVTPGALSRSYLCSSKAEAVEGALKLAKGFDRGRSEYVAIADADHGSTLGALSVSDLAPYRSLLPAAPLRACVAEDPDAAIAAVSERTAAVIAEPGPRGTRFDDQSPGWLGRLRARCSDIGALLIVDETATGFGRTGRMFAVDHERVAPDVLVFGGALGGSVLPLNGYITTHRVYERVYDRRDPTLHASATGGNPAGCVAGLEVLAAIDAQDVPASCAAGGEQLLRALERIAREHRAVVDIGVHGLLGRLWLRRDDVIAVMRVAYRLGVLVGARPTARAPFVELLPPLMLSAEELQSGLERVRAAIAVVEEQRDPR